MSLSRKQRQVTSRMSFIPFNHLHGTQRYSVYVLCAALFIPSSSTPPSHTAKPPQTQILPNPACIQPTRLTPCWPPPSQRHNHTACTKHSRASICLVPAAKDNVLHSGLLAASTCLTASTVCHYAHTTWIQILALGRRGSVYSARLLSGQLGEF